MKIGLGGGALGVMSEREASHLLDGARALGIEWIDVARSYGAAEERVGAWQRAHGDAFHVVTKGGYGIDGVEDWTGDALRAALAAARAKLGRVDVFLLHSCAPHVLDRDDVRRALADMRDVRLGYSGDNDALHSALDRAHALGFRAIEQSLSLLDGLARVHTLPRARGMFVIAKRALANAPWRESGSGHDYERQRARFLRAHIPDVGIPFDELFLRYAAFTPGVELVLVGTRRVEALERAVACVARGPLDDAVHRALAPALARCDDESLV